MIRVALLASLLALPGPAAPARPTDEILSRPPGQHEQVPEALAPALEALRKGDAQTALTLARTFTKSHPGSALGLEVLAEAARRQGQWKEAEQALGKALQLEPRRISALQMLGLVALGTADWKKAEERFRQAISAAPQLGAPYRGLATALSRQHRVAAAIKAAEQAVKLSSEDLEAKLQLAGLYHDAGRPSDADRLLAQVLAVRPDLAAAQVMRGVVNLELGKPDEASLLFEQVAAQDPSSRWARLGRALVSRARGQLPEARADLETLVKENQDWSVAHMELARTLLMQREREAALKALDQFERTSADPGQARLRGAGLLLTTANDDAAIVRARSLLGSASLAPAARAILVQAYLHRKEPEKAERTLRTAVDATPRDSIALMQLGRFYMGQSRGKDALAAFDRAAAIRPDDVEPVIGKAEASLMLGNTAAAITTAEQVVKMRGASPESYVVLGSFHQRVGRTADAIQAYRAALAKDPTHLAAMRALAASYDRNGQRADAAKLLQEAAKTHPRSPLPLLDLGALLQRHGDVDPAIAAYRDALQRAPDDPAVLNNLAYLLAKRPTTLAEAATLGERAYKRAPRNVSIIDTYGWILYQQGALDRALPLLEQAARQAPANAEVQYHLGAAYVRAGKRDEARRALEEALRNPRFDDAEVARKLLESLR